MPSIEPSYRLARERYAAVGVDTEAAMTTLADLSISIHCWQGDDVGGFEGGRALSGGIQATGNYPGKARTADELRADAAFAMALIPGRHRFNLHASYAETDGRGPTVDRDAITADHFGRWIDWAREQRIALDFNPTFFSHPWADDGSTLSSRDEGRRQFWIEHGRACRRIAAAFGAAQGSPSVHNIWIPDGSKDTPIDRKGPRERLADSLDAILETPVDRSQVLDAVEGKLFGLGLESYTVGSHEFYLGYAIRKGILLCLDAGHYHPTESLADKISAVLSHLDQILLHVSRGVRWDSDHVVVLDDALKAIAEEAVRGDYLGRIHLGLDFFDASINRVAAWVIGAQALQKALLAALLEPTARLIELEHSGDFTARLAWLEELKSLPIGDVWAMFRERHEVPSGMGWLDDVRRYEREVLATRSA